MMAFSIGWCCIFVVVAMGICAMLMAQFFTVAQFFTRVELCSILFAVVRSLDMFVTKDKIALNLSHPVTPLLQVELTN